MSDGCYCKMECHLKGVYLFTRTRAREVLWLVFLMPVLKGAMLDNHRYKKLFSADKLPIGQSSEGYQM